METELVEYLDRKFTTLEDKIDTCAKVADVKEIDKRLQSTEKSVESHNLIFRISGLVTLAGIGAWFKSHFGK